MRVMREDSEGREEGVATCVWLVTCVSCRSRRRECWLKEARRDRKSDVEDLADFMERLRTVLLRMR